MVFISGFSLFVISLLFLLYLLSSVSSISHIIRGKVPNDHQLFGFSAGDWDELNDIPYSKYLLKPCSTLITLFILIVSILVGLSINNWQAKIIPIIFIGLSLVDILTTVISVYFPKVNLNIKSIQGKPSIILDFIWSSFNLIIAGISYIYLIK